MKDEKLDKEYDKLLKDLEKQWQKEVKIMEQLIADVKFIKNALGKIIDFSEQEKNTVYTCISCNVVFNSVFAVKNKPPCPKCQRKKTVRVYIV